MEDFTLKLKGRHTVWGRSGRRRLGGVVRERDGKAISGDWLKWEGKRMERIHKEIGRSGKGRGWECYIKRLVRMGREGDGKVTSGDWVGWEVQETGKLHQEIGCGGKRTGWDGKVTSEDWVGWEGNGREWEGTSRDWVEWERRGWKGYIRRLAGMGREEDGKAKLRDMVWWEGKRRLEGVGREGKRKATSEDRVELEGRGWNG
jgi:hypothetical protein